MLCYVKYTVLISLALTGCAKASPPPERPALTALLKQSKFKPDGHYTGADTPEDRKPLQDAVDAAILDIRAMPDPLDREAVRKRLSSLLGDVDMFATEDRDEVGRYAIRVWRALGFKKETGLFYMSDDRVLQQ
ncbi:hypothetical protein D0Z70_10640 [Sphingobium terrigena]|uniref:Uncharacterized protein n=1 Tax=Sphingobium terrigena TaxID=2304063 RepID=A0A418YPW3_9SPHN|nr:hypothetical protein [Sphingobium terrigena]RJG53467.1 hypothetical protein D0Z70_15725 [Sphingobium terrigena]RJG53530.1 hypothetical protein D0Z70_16095 [Sphingobium terrigena]RJG54827.1 hypothetical protein D0Z70_10640 [Sphingobium terrigena]